MIDSDTTETFIFSYLIEKFELMTWKKQNDYELSVINKSQLETRINKETTPLSVAIQQHHETLTFDVVFMINHDIILDMSWLKTHNLNINWESWEIQFKQCDCIITIHSAHQQHMMTDEKQHCVTAEICEIFTLNKNDYKCRSDSADSCKSQQCQLVRVSEGNHTSSVISEILKKYSALQIRISQIYKKWEYLFQEERNADALFIHQSWDHKIKLEQSKQSMFELIYALSEKELEML